jgi:hypothetical protein
MDNYTRLVPSQVNKRRKVRDCRFCETPRQKEYLAKVDPSIPRWILDVDFWLKALVLYVDARKAVSKGSKLVINIFK